MLDRANQPGSTIVISASFTAEPLEPSLNFWGHELQNPFDVKFAPYSHVFQEMLDPSSLLSQNTNGMNVILVRFEDWIRNEKETLSNEDAQRKIKENLDNFVLALKSLAERSATPRLVCACPASPGFVASPEQAEFQEKMEQFLLSEISTISNVHPVSTAELTGAYPVAAYYDADSDELGHVPYTPAFFASLGTMIVRKYQAIRSAPYKVIALDCDQTLWKGICGEDGPLGIEIDAPRAKLQEFMVRQHDAGMLICLCSKNNEEDVIEVFEHHPEMPLRRGHIVSWRINWGHKSVNLRDLADELQLGLDSFIFIDDNPVECAEVEANCPEVVTLCLPQEPDSIPGFLEHLWCFDHLKITEEDRNRTVLYKQNIQREQLRRESLTLGDFLAGLKLQVSISEPAPEHLARVAQLTQRTNQFNFTTIRRSEADIQNLLKSGNLECLITEVSDRFGDYGLVGVALFKADAGDIKVDTFLLSCRVLGKGVEHRMLSRLGEIARERGLGCVEVSYVPTRKNQPAIDFLEGIGSEYKQQLGDEILFRFPADYTSNIKYNPTVEEPGNSQESATKESSGPPSPEKQEAGAWPKSELFHHIATKLCSAEQILNAIESSTYRQRSELAGEYVAPSSGLECSIASIWQKVLGIGQVGIQDNFFEIGGTSLKAVRLIAELRRECNMDIPVVTIFERPTIDSMVKMFGNGEEKIKEHVLTSRTRGERRRAALLSRRK